MKPSALNYYIDDMIRLVCNTSDVKKAMCLEKCNACNKVKSRDMHETSPGKYEVKVVFETEVEEINISVGMGDSI